MDVFSLCACGPLAGVTVKHKGRAVQVPCEAQRVTVQALSEACGEPIKGLQSFVVPTTRTHPTPPARSHTSPLPSTRNSGLRHLTPDGNGVISGVLNNATYRTVPGEFTPTAATSTTPASASAARPQPRLTTSSGSRLSFQKPPPPSARRSSTQLGADRQRAQPSPAPQQPRPEPAAAAAAPKEPEQKSGPLRPVANKAPSEETPKTPEKPVSTPTPTPTAAAAASPAVEAAAAAAAAPSPRRPVSGEGKKMDRKARKKLEQLEQARAYLEQVKRSNPALQQLLDEAAQKAVGNVPRWVPDEQSECCTYCRRKFTVQHRRHHCRKCGALLCAACTQYKLDLPELFFKKPVRVCVVCFVNYHEGKLDPVFFDERPEEEEDAEDAALSHSSPSVSPAPAAAAEGSAAAAAAAAAASSGDGDATKIVFLPADNKRLPFVVDEGDDDVGGDKDDRMRAKCIREIVVTEEAYVEDLRVLEDVFVFPLKMSGALTEEKTHQLFSNVEMLRPVHEALLKELREGAGVGRAFLGMCQYMKMYSLYCSNHENAIEILSRLRDDPEFMHALSICQSDSRARGQKLDSYIIKPVQRVCKYPLFFRELIKYTPPTHPDYRDLEQARAKIEEVVSCINEGKRKSEEQRKILSIFDSIEGEWEEELLQPTRGFVTEIAGIQGTDLRTNNRHEYTLFIFTDLIVVAKMVPGPGHQHKPLVLKGYIPMCEAKVIQICDTPTVRTTFELRRGNAQETLSKTSRVPVFQFVARDEQQKKSIMDTIRALIKKNINTSISRQSSGVILRSPSSVPRSKAPGAAAAAAAASSSAPASPTSPALVSPAAAAAPQAVPLRQQSQTPQAGGGSLPSLNTPLRKPSPLSRSPLAH